MSQANMQFALQTSSLVAGFMVWVILSSLMPYIFKDIPLSSSQLVWVATVRWFLVLIAGFAFLNLPLGDRKEPQSIIPLAEQFKRIYRNEKLWFLCLFYFITFGSFVAFTVYLPNFLVTHFQLDKIDAGFRTAGFIALASLIIVIWMYYQDKLGLKDRIFESTVEGIMVTDRNAVIQMDNPAFTVVTGYAAEEVTGKTPRILKSGKQGKEFYDRMWKALDEHGHWQGKIWNKRKNGEIYLEWLTISAIKNEGGEVKYYAGMFSDISQNQSGKQES